MDAWDQDMSGAGAFGGGSRLLSIVWCYRDQASGQEKEAVGG